MGYFTQRISYMSFDLLNVMIFLFIKRMCGYLMFLMKTISRLPYFTAIILNGIIRTEEHSAAVWLALHSYWAQNRSFIMWPISRNRRRANPHCSVLQR